MSNQKICPESRDLCWKLCACVFGAFARSVRLKGPTGTKDWTKLDWVLVLWTFFIAKKFHKSFNNRKLFWAKQTFSKALTYFKIFLSTFLTRRSLKIFLTKLPQHIQMSKKKIKRAFLFFNFLFKFERKIKAKVVFHLVQRKTKFIQKLNLRTEKSFFTLWHFNLYTKKAFSHPIKIWGKDCLRRN